MLCLALLCVSIYSFADVSYDRGICEFHGDNSRYIPPLQEQFARLLEPRTSQVFQDIIIIISNLAIIPPRILNNPECPVYHYTRDFLEYYKQNKEKITEDKLYVTKILDIIQETVEKVDAYKKSEL